MEDCYTSSRGHTRTLGNFVKAVYFALAKTYGYLSPELWTPTLFQVGFAVGFRRGVCVVPLISVDVVSWFLCKLCAYLCLPDVLSGAGHYFWFYSF